MSTLTIEGWCKRDPTQKSTPLGEIHFDIQGANHRRLEQAEEYLQQSHETETMVDVDLASMNLVLPPGCGPLADCRLRVYLSEEQRGQFHLVGHRASDGSLIYSNAVLIAQLS
ncbi:hypothetical protein C4Q28_13720 [Pseudomonas sp. SWI6]|uniref:Uncharacterized protein n=1 Tax=Pseudomonas taiwanensis TaxID=470150 RepID=A0ABR6V6J0_9PSED|nr:MULTISPECIES: hypothetical protein [Pseudomonas]AGZ35391.1 hypothetical protein PVLB_13025 [Pseudomonas sp. VLB120]AVD83148.1 hypothetical protein C4Q28_13720 [Pseudomonas sp. SWI6]AVD90308.1 hypothetical protein C4Q26_25545 [Pseudomonas sp. SWI44]MBC3475880.1 hypothetical protein [Pseudomonas taiwanensis]MBC3489307.1 hypothetical protein [Pseudomonas taiwanensis]